MTEIIAELGINHNGDFDTLINLADMAMESGADYVKLQMRTPTVCVPRDQWDIPREWFDGATVTYIEYKERMELSQEELSLFDDYMRLEYGDGRWFASVWDIQSLRNLMEFDVPYIKIPSALITSRKLIEACNEYNVPMIISTGMSTDDEYKACLSWIDPKKPVTIMHCNSAYPTADNEIDLATINTIKNYIDLFGGENDRVGFSSHSKSPFPAIYACVLGAEAVEVHVTLDRASKGTDHAASLEESGLRLLCREARKIPIMMGDGIVRVYESEIPARKKLRGDGDVG